MLNTRTFSFLLALSLDLVYQTKKSKRTWVESRTPYPIPDRNTGLYNTPVDAKDRSLMKPLLDKMRIVECRRDRGALCYALNSSRTPAPAPI